MILLKLTGLALLIYACVAAGYFLRVADTSPTHMQNKTLRDQVKRQALSWPSAILNLIDPRGRYRA